VNAGARWVVDALLAEVGENKLNEPVGLPLYKIDRLLRLAPMVVVDLIDETDAESIALVELADVVDAWCWNPTDPLQRPAGGRRPSSVLGQSCWG
jgi:hypothetical protein